MKIIVVGGTGTIGKAVVKALKNKHEIICVGHSQGDLQVDIQNENSIIKMYQTIDTFDGLIVTTGNVHFGALAEMKAEHYLIGLQSKLMGQINLVLQGLKYINDKGSFTLTSGKLNHDPIKFGSSAAMVNGAIDGFVTSAALELPKSVRINAVSPTLLTESLSSYGDYFPGFETVSSERVALAYIKSVEGAQTGQVYKVW